MAGQHRCVRQATSRRNQVINGCTGYTPYSPAGQVSSIDDAIPLAGVDTPGM